MANIEGKNHDCAGVSQPSEAEVPVGKGSRIVDINMSGESFDGLTTIAKVRRETLGCVVRKAVGNYITIRITGGFFQADRADVLRRAAAVPRADAPFFPERTCRRD